MTTSGRIQAAMTVVCRKDLRLGDTDWLSQARISSSSAWPMSADRSTNWIVRISEKPNWPRVKNVVGLNSAK
ncbi:hypothetical protein D3C72_1974480 [compost metagenome]